MNNNEQVVTENIQNFEPAQKEERLAQPRPCMLQSGAHQLGGAAGVAGGALGAVELEDESSDGGGGVALHYRDAGLQRTASPCGSGRRPRGWRRRLGLYPPGGVSARLAQ